MDEAPPQVVLACVGHIDHGKSSLVEALSASGSTDRLPAERARGMTIELGYAFLNDGQEPACEIACIDCPGHERFVRRMVAGACGSDGALLVVAADAGIQAQTREHLEVLRLLQIAWGRVVITRCDLATAEQIAACEAAVAKATQGSPLAVHPPALVSSVSGMGIAELRTWLCQQARQRLSAPDKQDPRLAIDRAFSLAGRGTVVAGTLLSGSLHRGQTVQLYPGPEVRIRSLQVHGKTVERAQKGQRVALNLASCALQEVQRGAWVSLPGSLQASTCLDIQVEALDLGIRHRALVEVLHGTALLRGRCYLDAGKDEIRDQGSAQLRLEGPLFAHRGDRVILRRPAPPANLAAAQIADPQARPRRRRGRGVGSAHSGGESLLLHLRAAAPAACSQDALQDWAGGQFSSYLESVRDQIQQEGTFYWAKDSWQALGTALIAACRRRADNQPERCWWSFSDLGRDFPDIPSNQWPAICQGLQRERAAYYSSTQLCLIEGMAALPRRSQAAAASLLAVYQAAGLSPAYDHPLCAAEPDPPAAERALTALRERGHLVRINDRQHIAVSHLQPVITRIQEYLQQEGAAIDIQWMKAEYALSRRWAVPILEWCDSQQITRRVGNQRQAGSRRNWSLPQIPLLTDPTNTRG